ncbi:hypothetical protein GQR58_026189 [Nymphon striatum]|nr:hypothetical protein GQR58_026189 [Nymphon striatum]
MAAFCTSFDSIKQINTYFNSQSNNNDMLFIGATLDSGWNPNHMQLPEVAPSSHVYKLMKLIGAKAVPWYKNEASVGGEDRCGNVVQSFKILSLASINRIHKDVDYKMYITECGRGDYISIITFGKKCIDVLVYQVSGEAILGEENTEKVKFRVKAFPLKPYKCSKTLTFSGSSPPGPAKHMDPRSATVKEEYYSIVNESAPSHRSWHSAFTAEDNIPYIITIKFVLAGILEVAVSVGQVPLSPNVVSNMSHDLNIMVKARKMKVPFLNYGKRPLQANISGGCKIHTCGPISEKIETMAYNQQIVAKTIVEGKWDKIILPLFKKGDKLNASNVQSQKVYIMNVTQKVRPDFFHYTQDLYSVVIPWVHAG